VERNERTQILEQLDNGQVSVEDAVGMMAAQNEQPARSERAPAPRQASERRWLRLRVSDLETGDSKVSVSIPFSWVKFGWKLGSRFVSELQDMDLDEMTDALEQDVEGYFLQVEDENDNKRVEIFVD
jgi:hypothetical protein